MWDLAQSGYSIEILFFPASLSKLSAVCLSFWVTEMFFHSPPPSFLPGSLSSPSIFLISSTVHFTGLVIFLLVSSSQSLTFYCRLLLPRPGLFAGCPAPGALREGGRDGLYGNPEKRMPSSLICIQTVSFAYRQTSSAYAQWDSESRFLSVCLDPPSPVLASLSREGSLPTPSAPVWVWAFLFPKGSPPSVAPLLPAVTSVRLSFPVLT